MAVVTPDNRVRRSRSWTVMDGTDSPFVPRPDKRKRPRLGPESLGGIPDDNVVASTPDTVIIKTPMVAASSHRDHNHPCPCEQRGGVLEEEDVVEGAPEPGIIETPTVMPLPLRRTMMLWIWALRSWMHR